MSLTLEVRGQTSSHWALTPDLLMQIERLRKTDARGAVEVLFGSEDEQAGTARVVDHATLLQSTAEILPLARRLPGGFQVSIPHAFEGALSAVAAGVGGVLIEGRYYYIRCWDDYWTIQPGEELGQGKEPVHRYDPAEISTQSHGTIVVEAKKSRGSPLVKLLRDLRKFLEADPGNSVTITWG